MVSLNDLDAQIAAAEAAGLLYARARRGDRSGVSATGRMQVRRRASDAGAMVFQMVDGTVDPQK